MYHKHVLAFWPKSIELPTLIRPNISLDLQADSITDELAKKLTDLDLVFNGLTAEEKKATRAYEILVQLKDAKLVGKLNNISSQMSPDQLSNLVTLFGWQTSLQEFLPHALLPASLENIHKICDLVKVIFKILSVVFCSRLVLTRYDLFCFHRCCFVWEKSKSLLTVSITQCCRCYRIRRASLNK